MDGRSSDSGRLSKKARTLILICIPVMFFTGCPEKQYRTFVLKDQEKGFKFTYEIPVNWEILSRDLLHIVSPESIEGVSAGIGIHQRHVPLKEIIENAENKIERFAKEYPDYKQEPFKPVQVGKFKAITYSCTYLYTFAAYVSHHISPGEIESIEDIKKLPPRPNRKPVFFKETYIYFEDPEMDCCIRYSAPVAIYDDKTKRATPVDMYDRYLPVLTHLLETFKKIEK